MICIPGEAFHHLLADHKPSIRLAAISLVISSNSITRPLPIGSLYCLRKHLFHLFAEVDAQIRADLLTVIQRLVDRLRAITFSVQRPLPHNIAAGSCRGNPIYSEALSPAARQTLHDHERFIDWLIDFFHAGLRPGGPYQRHFLSLKSYLIFAKSGIDANIKKSWLAKQATREVSWRIHRELFAPPTRRLLLDLLLDPFDDVRGLAASLLNMSPGTVTHELQKDLRKFLTRAELMMLSSGRADHADGVSRTYSLIFSRTSASSNPQGDALSVGDYYPAIDIVRHLVATLEETLAVAGRDLAHAMRHFPVHGILASIKYITSG